MPAASAASDDTGRKGSPFACASARAVATPEELAERLQTAGAAPLAAGDGSLRFRQVVEGAGARVAPAGSHAHVVRALHVCRLAAGLPDSSPDAVVPHYLRAPDATPNR